MLVLIDNYDSFTWNVAGMLAEQGAEVEFVRNDAIDVAGVLALQPERIILSPGPGGPADAGICEALVHAAVERCIPLVGICLGMQVIGHAFGASIVRLDHVVHGSASPIDHDGSGVFAGVPAGFAAGRYHSLVVEEASLPAELVATAHTPDGVLMGVRHRTLPIEGVQFHPESILTPEGHRLLANCVRTHDREVVS
ncbi:MAG: anthranilate synthase, component [Thermoleophilia bacterium]|nr:anthranilate synthase, component [Thermoleophilia bacterium]